MADITDDLIELMKMSKQDLASRIISNSYRVPTALRIYVWAILLDVLPSSLEGEARYSWIETIIQNRLHYSLLKSSLSSKIDAIDSFSIVHKDLARIPKGLITSEIQPDSDLHSQSIAPHIFTSLSSILLVNDEICPYGQGMHEIAAICWNQVEIATNAFISSTDPFTSRLSPQSSIDYEADTYTVFAAFMQYLHHHYQGDRDLPLHLQGRLSDTLTRETQITTQMIRTACPRLHNALRKAASHVPGLLTVTPRVFHAVFSRDLSPEYLPTLWDVILADNSLGPPARPLRLMPALLAAALSARWAQRKELGLTLHTILHPQDGILRTVQTHKELRGLLHTAGRMADEQDVTRVWPVKRRERTGLDMLLNRGGWSSSAPASLPPSPSCGHDAPSLSLCLQRAGALRLGMSGLMPGLMAAHDSLEAPDAAHVRLTLARVRLLADMLGGEVGPSDALSGVGAGSGDCACVGEVERQVTRLATVGGEAPSDDEALEALRARWVRWLPGQYGSELLQSRVSELRRLHHQTSVLRSVQRELLAELASSASHPTFPFD
eukprot:gnl/Dysnectes_brevis/3357_a4224_507.p1 GENE.gnl/Dysnectes_brevis/3357_a4224_507~~gnl/Dysnectes_brevis/3357_a4224_507.p1  ORF type:complete len:551 (+),score=124.87 gnl/Dysnectes_brevis/3357_a4224_507:81-1733(+)